MHGLRHPSPVVAAIMAAAMAATSLPFGGAHAGWGRFLGQLERVLAG